MVKAPANESNDTVQTFFFDKFPQGLVLLPSESRQCADTPSARKYKTQMATSLSIEKPFTKEPQAAKDITIPVYGKNKIPTPSLKFLEPNFGTNHSDILSFCIRYLTQFFLILCKIKTERF